MAEREIQQLVEMVCLINPYKFPPWVTHYFILQGATTAQARAALKQYKDVMTAAESIFEGKFDHITDADDDIQVNSKHQRPSVCNVILPYAPPLTLLQTPDEDEDEDDPMADEDDDGRHLRLNSMGC